MLPYGNTGTREYSINGEAPDQIISGSIENMKAKIEGKKHLSTASRSRTEAHKRKPLHKTATRDQNTGSLLDITKIPFARKPTPRPMTSTAHNENNRHSLPTRFHDLWTLPDEENVPYISASKGYFVNIALHCEQLYDFFSALFTQW